MSAVDPDSWLRVSRHLDSLLELPDAERADYLATLCRDDPVTASHVTRLLSAVDKPSFVEFLARAVPFATPETSASLVGRRIGPYVVEAEVGQGGMGSVWRARRADGRFEGQVAIKLPYLAWLGKEGTERFLREGRLLGRLDHPNVARLVDAGVLEEGQPYLVLEYVEGTPIHEYCDAMHLSLRARLQLFLPVLSAVAHAHQQLIVHRDLKPTNVLVTRDGTVKLLDFGIAKLLLDRDADASLRAAESRVFTPEFAAPEQLLGAAVTTATDVYALGELLYLILAGRHPFAEHTPGAALNSRLSYGSEPPRASTFRRELRGDLDNILAKALRWASPERYSSVEAFSEDLRRFLADEPVSAGSDSIVYRAVKFTRRNAAAVSAGALVVIVLVASTAVTSLEMLEARHQRDDAQFQARRSDAETEFLDALMQSDGGPGRPALSASERLALGVRMLESQYSGDPRFTGRMLLQLADQYRGRNQRDEAVALSDRAYQLGKRVNDLELMALAQCIAARTEAVSGNTARTPARLTEAQQLIARLSSPAVMVQVEYLRAKAQLGVQTGHFGSAEADLVQARRLLEETGETYRAAYTSVLNDLGGIYNDTGRLPQALAMAELIGTTHERYGRGGTSARAIALHNEAVVLGGMGEIRAELQRLDQATKLLEADYAEDALPLSLVVNRAEALRRLGRADEARAEAGRAVERAKRLDDRRWLIMAQLVLFSTDLDTGKLTDAQQEIDAATAVYRQSGSASRKGRIPAMMDLASAQLALARGEPQIAERDALSVLGRSDPTDSRPVSEARSAYRTAAEAALLGGRPDAARKYIDQALALAERYARGSDSSADVGEVLVLSAKARLAQNPSEDVRPLLARAVRALTSGLGAQHPLVREAADLSRTCCGTASGIANHST